MLQRLYSQKDVNDAYSHMALAIEKDDLDDTCFVMILKGGVFVGFHLFPRFRYPHDNCKYGFIGVSSYGGEVSPTQNVMLTYPLDLAKKDIQGKVVWVIDDVVESGATLNFVLSNIEILEPKQIKTCCLVSREKNLCDVYGFIVEKGFVVGCGMGLGEKYRDLPLIYNYSKE